MKHSDYKDSFVVFMGGISHDTNCEAYNVHGHLDNRINTTYHSMAIRLLWKHHLKVASFYFVTV